VSILRSGLGLRRVSRGSYVIVQKYPHDLDRWDALAVEERAIGRRKLNDIELPDDVKPANSHVAVNTIVDADGTQRRIVRENVMFGRAGAGEYGTYFIGYAAGLADSAAGRAAVDLFGVLSVDTMGIVAAYSCGVRRSHGRGQWWTDEPPDG
jgi:deferrochelatase/peroxidase EfeB